ncbi:MAG: heparan-alpha-glucosaminide N-acetyltransferase domain-containing protein [Pedobacter sp.]|uniref:acyltransferase family protein n=1 Tax=Pedobacter sp. TaxID=1411316 RepID=UPI00280A274D|nr:acyltransferase family protein [Pedobacter sp.]MDQ8003572.1 heparan-alpha-glucosaminide N-acetyltransferase domain-containing protein [Pedobacter sp.]
MKKTISQRYLSLDVLRGLTVALMIVVNTPGSWSHIYAPFKHAEWHGFTLTDLVFPTFLFVVGNALSFSLKKLEEVSFGDFFKKVAKRALIIFIIGLLLNLFPFVVFGEDGSVSLKNFLEVRIFGVLQRIALCYFFGSLIIYFFRKTTSIAVISAVILLTYWGILYYFGQLGNPYSLEGNAAKALDDFLFNSKNLYQGFGVAFDPEGLLSTFPAIVNVLIGYLTGKYLQKQGNNPTAVYRLVGVGIAFLALGFVWNYSIPINKPIWTSSYVLFSLGWDLVITGLLIALIDVLNFKKWTYFFEVFGKNALFIYILAWIIMKLLYLIKIDGSSLPSLFYKNGLTSWLADKNASLVFAILYMLLLWIIGLILDKKKIYVKV